MAERLIEGNAVIGQSGGPTAVINASLVGVVEGLKVAGAGQAGNPIKRILGMRHAVRGLTEDRLVDLTDKDQDFLDALAATPSAGLGSTRDKPDAAYCERIFHACEKHDIRYFFYIGGNDSSDTCRIVNELADQHGYELRCFHVPKTVDNDLMVNDHTPGFPSAARFVAKAFMADSLDNASIPGVKINVVMGRHAGFLTAASALARTHDGDGPHLIYLPEKAFDTEDFVQQVARIYDRLGRCQIAVSEGVQDKDGVAITTKLFEGETDAHGNVQLSGTGALGDALSTLVKDGLKTASGAAPRVRADTFGYLQRCYPDASPIDQDEARRAGRYAAMIAAGGDMDGSVAILRTGKGYDGDAYKSELDRIDLTEVAAKTRHMDPEFFQGDHDVSQAFIDYCTPLVGELPKFPRL
jgi:6-phosphofructokinase